MDFVHPQYQKLDFGFPCGSPFGLSDLFGRATELPGFGAAAKSTGG